MPSPHLVLSTSWQLTQFLLGSLEDPSHCSVPSRILFPQVASTLPEQSVLQALYVALLLAVQSSQNSPELTRPSPQLGKVQSLRQASLSTKVPSSQASASLLKLSPQRCSVQLSRQASVSTVFPSSQASVALLKPSPQL